MSDSNKGIQSNPTNENQAPQEFYANSVGANMGAFDMFIDFAVRTPERPDHKPSARVHMSIQHAWVMTKVLDRLFAQYRQSGGTITLPEQVLNELGLLEEYREDWGSK